MIIIGNSMSANRLTLQLLRMEERALIKEQGELNLRLDHVLEELQAIRILKKRYRNNDIEEELLINEINPIEKIIEGVVSKVSTDTSKYNNLSIFRRKGRLAKELPLKSDVYPLDYPKKHKVYWIVLNSQGITYEKIADELVRYEPDEFGKLNNNRQIFYQHLRSILKDLREEGLVQTIKEGKSSIHVIKDVSK